jgi:hypothetical protein
MAVTVTPTPQYAVVTKPPKLSFSATTGQRVRLFLTNAPVASKFKTQLNESSAGRVQIFQGDVGETHLFEADVPGAYTLLAQEIQVPTFKGGFKGDTRGFLDVGGGRGVEKILGEAETTIYMGDRVTVPLGTQPHTATLVMWVWGLHIVPTTVELHGEVSPDIIDPSTPIAKTAANSTAVRTTLAQLENQTAQLCALGGSDMASILDEMINTLNAHFLNEPGVHGAADTSNEILDTWKSADSKGSVPDTVTKMLDSLTKHITTDAANSATVLSPTFGRGTGSWHLGQRSDGRSKLLVQTVSELQDSWVGMADIRRAYALHRTNTSLHNVPDATVMPTAPRLLAVHEAFLSVVASSEPPPAPDENPGASLLVHAAGAELG